MGDTRSTGARLGRFWPEALAASLSLAVTLLVWQVARTSDRTHTRRMTHLAASAIKEDLSTDSQSWRRDLVRLAKLWDSPDGPTFSEWKANAELYIQHHSGCVAVEWIQPSYEERWLVLAPGEATEGPTFDEAKKRFLQPDSAINGAYSTPVFTGKGGLKQQLTVVPISRNNKFEGFVVALIDVQRSTDFMLADVMGLGYSILIREAGREIYRLQGTDLGTEKQWGESSEFHLPGGVVWNLSVWPRATVLSELASSLPRTILLAGGLLSLLLTMTVGLVRLSSAKSLRLQSANADLEASAGEQRRAEAALRSSEGRLAAILDISADAVISVNQQMQIILFNQGAEKIFGYKHEEILGRHLDILIPERYRSNHAQHVAEFGHSAHRAMLMCGRNAVFGLRKDGTEFPMEVSLAKLHSNGDTIYTAIARDITERLRVQEELRRSRDELEFRVQERTAELRLLASHVVRLEDEERRRIARELHDGTTQSLVALSAELIGIEKTLHDPDAVSRKVRYSRELVKQSLDEIRTVSYLLHPPLLDELGLDTALRGFVEGFSARSEIEVSLNLPSDLSGLPRDLQLAIFRVVQESLTNVHRHSGSRSASIHLTMTPDKLTLEIADQGRGMSPVLPISRAGVGINSMRERIRQLGGHCEIESNGRGTTIRAVMPTTRAAAADPRASA
jgi:PAS domain S-box-containing protein